jgi:hypothetical protein
LLEAVRKLEAVPRPNPALPSHLVERGLTLFSILLELEKTQFLRSIWSFDFINRQLPLDLSKVEELMDAGIPDASTLAADFYAKEWKYYPAILRLDESMKYHKRRIVPILNADPIKPSGTAELTKIEVLEDFVVDRLKAQVPQSRYLKDDGSDTSSP